MAKCAKPIKPYPSFPLTPHAGGRWCKKIHGKIHYFGTWADPLGARDEYLAFLDRRQGKASTLQPPTTGEEAVAGPKVHDLINHFLNEKRKKVASRERAKRTLETYERLGKALSAFWGRSRPLADLDFDDFDKLRAHLAKGRSLVSLGNELRFVRTVFNHGWKKGVIDESHGVKATPLRLNSWLEMPSENSIRAERNKRPEKMLEAVELRSLIQSASTHLRAMILLGLNCGFGNNDVSQLTLNSVDLKTGWVDFPRPKTGIKRRCPLWPESVRALVASLEKRRKPQISEAEDKFFVTKYGNLFVRSNEKGTQIDSVALEFGKLLTDFGMKKSGLNFYALRHVFETIAGDSKDQVAVDHIMGHVPKSDDMSAVYRRRINDGRLSDVAEHVRKWLWPEGSEAAWREAEDQREKAKGDKNSK